MTTYLPDMAMDHRARAPEPGPLAGYAASYSDKEYLARTDPLTMLTLNDDVRSALRDYDEACVYAARMAGATWAEVGTAMGMERQNVQRKYRHLPQPPRDRRRQ